MNKLKLILLVLTGLLTLGVGFFTVRQAWASGEIKNEIQAISPAGPALGASSRVEIMPLYEAAAIDENLIKGHGVSYLIRTDSTTILLDVGNNPDRLAVAPFMQNMLKLQIGPEEVDMVVISHTHPDHVGGNEAWMRGSLSIGELPADWRNLPVYVPVKMSYPGAVVLHDPILLAADVATTGALSYPEVFPLSLLAAKGAEQALVVNLAGEGLVVITGCGHPGLERLVQRAETLYGLPVTAVIGGLHYLRKTGDDLQAEISFLESREPRIVALSPHDSGPEALQAFEAAFPQSFQSIEIGRLLLIP